jgi:hypothetical protein
MKMWFFCFFFFCGLGEILSYLNLNALFNLDIIHMWVSCLKLMFKDVVWVFYNLALILLNQK